MILSKIWERYCFFETLKTLLFLLSAFYLTFILIDFSTNSIHFFRHSPPNLLEIILYYLHHFVNYLDVFFPLSLLLSTAKVLLGMNTRNELSSLQGAGLSSYRICRPFFLLASILALLSYLNTEYLAPHSLEYIEEFKIAHSKNPERHNENSLHVQSLDKQKKLIFQKYDASKNALYDVFWIPSSKEIFHCKHLLLTTPPEGLFVDHFQRNQNNLLEKLTSHEQFLFQDMPSITLDHDNLSLPSENRALSTLFAQVWKKSYSSKEEKANILTALHLKLVSPLFSFLVLLAIFPFCVRFSRYFPSFLLYVFSLFGFIVFYTLLDASVILAENQVLSPHLLIWGPVLAAFTFFGFRFFKLSR